MPAPYDIITFDCYGTLIDWESGIGDAFLSAAREDGIALEREAVLKTYAEIEPAVEAGPWRPYREVLEESARRVADRLGWRWSTERGRFLPESLPEWRPFPDTNPALERLSRLGCRLGILSNVDDDLIVRTYRHFTVPFDPIITAQQVRSYKPAHGHFLEARRRLAGQRWLHAAQSWFHDIVPAEHLGLNWCWVNRRREPAPVPVAPIHNLSQLAHQIEAMRS